MSDFSFKIHQIQFNFSWGSAPDLGGQRSQTPSWIWEGKGKGMEGEDKRSGRERQWKATGRGREEKGKFLDPFIFPACVPAINCISWHMLLNCIVHY